MKFHQDGLISRPSNNRFPVVDFVFSCADNGPIISFQCTWQNRHPLTVRALYDLRINHMEIDDGRQLNIYIVSPGKEQKYASLTKTNFLEGSLDAALQFTKSIVVPATRLQQMWQSTKIWVLCPQTSWQEMIADWLKDN